MTVELRNIYAARKAIDPWVRRTPLICSSYLSERLDASVYLKLETTHDIGSFKIRGATNRVLNLSEDERWKGIVAVSTGNHGRAVAYAAQKMGIHAIVCMSSLVKPNKVEATKQLGAEVRIIGDSQDEAEEEARRLVAEEKMTLVHPFDDEYVIAGQGTIGIEIIEDLPEVDLLISGVSGGGLIGGMGTVMKAVSPDIRVVGVSMERGPAMIKSLEAGHPVIVEEQNSLADSLGGGIGLDNRFTFELVRAVVDQTITVSEQQIAHAMQSLYRHDRIVAEGGAVVSVAALLEGKIENIRGNIVCVISGENVDMDVFQSVIGGSYSDI